MSSLLDYVEAIANKTTEHDADWMVPVKGPQGNTSLSKTPSAKDGTGFVAGFVAIIVGTALLLTVAIFFLTKQLERRRQAKKVKAHEKKGTSLISRLPCYRWDHTELGNTSSCSSLSNINEHADKHEQPLAAEISRDEPENKMQIDASKKHGVMMDCALCSREFDQFSYVCESNNPNCRHIFHKDCIEKWLNYQYTCPTCNEVYALQES